MRVRGRRRRRRRSCSSMTTQAPISVISTYVSRFPDRALTSSYHSSFIPSLPPYPVTHLDNVCQSSRHRRHWTRRTGHQVRYRYRARELALRKAGWRRVVLRRVVRSGPEVSIRISETLLCAISSNVRTRRNAEQTKKLFEKYKPTHVIHLGALGMLSASLSVHPYMTWTHARIVGGLFINMKRKVRTRRRTLPYASAH